MKYTLEHIRENNYIIFEAIMGSRAYGTSLPTSDVDIRGVFIQPLEDIFKYGYIDQINDTKNDIIFYELKRFLNLVGKNNPNIMELLNAPEENIQFKDPIYDLVLEKGMSLISKDCKMTFAGYAIQQIKKARGLNKKMNWEESEMKRRGALDFCYVLDEGKNVPFDEWSKKFRSSADTALDVQKHFALSNIDHAHDVYAMYDMSNLSTGRGIVTGEDAMDIHLTSIPKNSHFLGYLTFNKDGYSLHCKRYKEYQVWLENRNKDRVKMNKAHGKQYDSKNMMHTYRLLNMSLEIANDHEINVRRSDRELLKLMKIRKGEFEFDDLIVDAEKMIIEMDLAYESSTLPLKADLNVIRELELKMRKQWYRLQK